LELVAVEQLVTDDFPPLPLFGIRHHSDVSIAHLKKQIRQSRDALAALQARFDPHGMAAMLPGRNAVNFDGVDRRTGGVYQRLET
jgi:hypothetical protein